MRISDWSSDVCSSDLAWRRRYPESTDLSVAAHSTPQCQWLATRSVPVRTRWAQQRRSRSLQHRGLRWICGQTTSTGISRLTTPVRAVGDLVGRYRRFCLTDRSSKILQLRETYMARFRPQLRPSIEPHQKNIGGCDIGRGAG